MARKTSSRAGFTILEVLVSAFLTALAVTGLVSVLGTVSNTQARIYLTERMERAADDKLNELIATGEITADSEGAFDNGQDADLSWSSTYQETGTENLAHAQVVVSKGDLTATADRLLFIRPEPTEEENEEGATP